jgi:TMEM175 potassium channel family protein
VTTSRLTSFTDGVIAVIITIMVLELPVPKAPGMAALQPLTILFVVYALSFVKVGTYWVQHHNVFQASRRVNGQVLLANLFFLFWLGLIPFVVRWIGEDGLTRDTVIAFGVIMLLCTLSFALLFWVLFMANRDDAPLRKLTKAGHRGRITIIAYPLAIALAFVWPLVSVAIYAVVAVMWLLPEKKFEQLLD